MLIITTSPAGRQKLLSNLYLRNYLYNKYLTIQVGMEDKLNKDGDLDLSAPLVMDINDGTSKMPLEAVISTDFLDVIKGVIEEKYKYLADFKI